MQKDDLLKAELGARPQKVTDDELRAQIPNGDYTQTQPVTLYTEALKNKADMMSAGVGPNPFAKTSGLTQPV